MKWRTPLLALTAVCLFGAGGATPCLAADAVDQLAESVDFGVLTPGAPSKWNDYSVWSGVFVKLGILDAPRVRANSSTLNEFISKNHIDVAAQFGEVLLSKIKSMGFTALLIEVSRSHGSTGGAIDRAQIPPKLKVHRLIDPSFQYLVFYDPTLRPAALAMGLRARFLSPDGLPEDLPLSVYYNDAPHPPGTSPPQSGRHLTVIPITDSCRFSTFEKLVNDLGAFQACLKGALDAMAEAVVRDISK